MRNMNRIIALAVIVLSAQLLFAQHPAWCGTDTHIRELSATNAGFAAAYQQYKDDMRNEQVERAGSHKVNTDYEVIFIPVVFHVVHNGDAVGSGENISDAQIHSQMDALNRDFNFNGEHIGLIPEPFRPLISNCKIKFCLAQSDPMGQPTTGILRHNFPVASWNSRNQIDSMLKPVTIWDRNVYMNVWVVNMAGALNTEGLLGYAVLPIQGATPASTDGIVMRHTAVGSTGNIGNPTQQGKTLTHEVGHWFGLLHIWGDDGNRCLVDTGGTDFIDDTPDQGDLNMGCPAFPHVSCNNGPNGDMFMNYMDYTDDLCKGIFTRQQTDRMRSVLNGFRSSLDIALTACFYDLDADMSNVILPGDTVCSLSFQPIIFLRNGGVLTLNSGKVNYKVDNGATQTLDWTGPLTTGERTYIILPVQNLSAGNHTLTVSFDDPNVTGIDNNTVNDSKTINFYAYDGGPATSATFTQGFEGTFPANNWEIENLEGDTVTWEQYPRGAYGTSANSMRINNRTYTAQPNRKRDALISDNYDFSGISYPELSFDIAYARLNGNRQDSFNVYYSLDCGSSWIRLWSAKGTQLSTAPDVNPLFTPADSQWKAIKISLWPVIGLKKVRLKFENVTGWGNALYVDNINVRNNPLMSVEEEPGTTVEQAVQIEVFPNPATDMVAVRLPIGHTYRQVQLLNSIGQLAYETGVNGTALIIPVESLPAGLYFIRLYGPQGEQVKKVLISR